jgi:hypothetical protein
LTTSARRAAWPRGLNENVSGAMNASYAQAIELRVVARLEDSHYVERRRGVAHLLRWSRDVERVLRPELANARATPFRFGFVPDLRRHD